MHYFPRPQGHELEVRTLTQQLTRSFLAPYVEEDDRTHHFRREAFQELAKAKLVALMLPKQFGGGGRPSIEYYAFVEELSRVSMSLSVAVGVTNLTMGGILGFGSKEQKENYLPKLISGEWLGAFSLSEPGSGSDAASLKLAAQKVDGGYRLKGNKLWCSSAGYADLYLVMARTAQDKTRGVTSFLVKKEAPGFVMGKQEKKLGLRASSLAELVFDDCFVPETDRLGPEGEGLTVAFSQLDLGRIGIGACALGGAIEALDLAWKQKNYAEAQEHQAAEFYTQIQAVKSLMQTTAAAKDSGVGVSILASHLKSFASDIAMRVASFSLELMAEAGYREGSRIERIFRDLKALQIVEGTNQVQRMLLARHMRENG